MLEQKGSADQARARVVSTASRTSRSCRSSGSRASRSRSIAAKIAHYGLNVADVNGLIEAAVGGTAATQVVQGESGCSISSFGLQPQFRETPEQIGNILISTPAGGQVPLREVANIQIANGASFIYRQDNSRYIGVQYSVEGRDLASAVQDAQKKVAAKVKMPAGLSTSSGAASTRNTPHRASSSHVVLPMTFVLIFVLLFGLYQQLQVSRSSPWSA